MRYFIDTNRCKKDADGKFILTGASIYEWSDQKAEAMLKNETVKSSFVELQEKDLPKRKTEQAEVPSKVTKEVKSKKNG